MPLDIDSSLSHNSVRINQRLSPEVSGMGFKKCPICELNYIAENETSCAVCKRAQHGSDNDDSEMLCIECGENPVVRGTELCASCLREARRQEKLQKSVESIADTEMDVGALDDMEVPIAEEEEDIPESEMEEIHKELDDGFMDEEEEEEEKPEERD